MIRLVDMSDDEFRAYLARAVTNYADEISRANDLTPDVAQSQAEATFRRLLPEGHPRQEDQYMFSVVDEAERRVGMIWFGIRRDRKRPYAYIWDIYLEPDTRGKGYGEQVMRQVEDRVRDLGYDHIALNVFGHNLPARKLYERLGFQAIAISMGKDL